MATEALVPLDFKICHFALLKEVGSSARSFEVFAPFWKTYNFVTHLKKFLRSKRLFVVVGVEVIEVE